jgi:hypothetical protein
MAETELQNTLDNAQNTAEQQEEQTGQNGLKRRGSTGFCSGGLRPPSDLNCNSVLWTLNRLFNCHSATSILIAGNYDILGSSHRHLFQRISYLFYLYYCQAPPPFGCWLSAPNDHVLSRSDCCSALNGWNKRPRSERINSTKHRPTLPTRLLLSF